MRILKINVNNPDPEIIREAVQIITKGGAVVLPTDTAYGIAVNALDNEALAHLDKIKARQNQKPYPLAVLGFQEAEKYAIFNEQAKILAQSFWPGALTLVLRRKKGTQILSETIGVRVPDSRLCHDFSKALGFPYTITSANISGMPSAYTAEEVVRQFERAEYQPDLILDGGELPRGRISTVVDLSCGEIKILREGEILFEEILNILKNKKFKM